MRLLRFVSISEGVSYLLLLLVAMPLKYLCDMPLAVKFVGWAHGMLFIALTISALLAMALAALPFKAACVVGIASLLPAGPFFADRLLRRHVEEMAASRIPRRGQAKKHLGGPDAAVADG